MNTKRRNWVNAVWNSEREVGMVKLRRRAWPSSSVCIVETRTWGSPVRAAAVAPVVEAGKGRRNAAVAAVLSVMRRSYVSSDGVRGGEVRERPPESGVRRGGGRLRRLYHFMVTHK